MNEFDKNKKIETLLEETAEQVQPNLMFKAELEEKLRKAHKPRAAWTFPRFNNLASALTGVVVLGTLALFTLWIFQSLEPQTNFGNDNFSCPVTEPNGSVPPGENMQDPYFYGNGEIWTTLWPEGRVVMQNDNLEPDGAFAMKWLIYRGVTGELSIEGRRLDADAEPLRSFMSDGYGDNGVQILALIFPTTGCWEVTTHMGDSSLTFVTEVIYNGEIVSTPDAISDPSLTPTNATIGGYDFRGGKLFLAQPLPQSPATANVFALQDYPPATLEQARALADRFGFQGEFYTAPGRMPNTTDYVITDGKRLLSVSTEGSFYYTTDMVKNTRGFTGKSYDNAEAIIRDFLNSHGFNFDFQVSESGFGSYLIHPMSEDGASIQYESFTDPIIRVVLDENSEVLRVDVNLVNYDQNAVGTYDILSAEEALQAILASNSATRVLETMYPAPHAGPQQWYRDHADEEKVTIYGALGIFASIDAAKPSLYFIDGMPVVGNTNGLEEVGNYVLVEANGQFVTENGNRQFIVDSWSRDVDLGFYSGTLRNENGQILFTLDDGSGTEYPLIDPPADVPLNTQTPESQLLINGNIKDGMFNWTSIQYFADSSQMGGGGGGGGLGFYPLNLSGTPIPFPTPAESSIPSANLDTTNALTYVVQEGDTLSQIASMYGLTPEQLMQANGLTEMTIVIGQSLLIPGTTAPPQLDGARGMLNITIYTREDGSERTQYAFLSSDPQNPYMILEGNGLEELLPYHNKPIRVWGSADHLGQFGAPVISVERFEVLFPDLQFQLMTGTEELVQLEGKDVVLLTTDSGERYVEFGGNCSDVFGYESMSSKRDNVEKMQLEVLAVPDLSFGGYPVICVFSTGIATDQNGNAYGMEMTASQPFTIPEPVFGTGSQPNLTIDSVELIYYASNPNILLYDPTLTERYPYMQPVWRFLGTYDTGEKVEFAVQALKQEYLSPDSNP